MTIEWPPNDGQTSEQEPGYIVQRVRVGLNTAYRIKGSDIHFCLRDVFAPNTSSPPIEHIFLRTQNKDGEENIYLITRKGSISNRRINQAHGRIIYEKLSDATKKRSLIKWDEPFYFRITRSKIDSNTSRVKEIILVEQNPLRRIHIEEDLPQNSIEQDFFKGLLPFV